MKIPLLNGKPHPIVHLVLSYLKNTENKITFNTIRRKICKDIIACIIGIENWTTSHPYIKWQKGEEKRKFLFDTLEWCKIKLSLNKKAIENWIHMVIDGKQIKHLKFVEQLGKGKTS